MSYLNAHYQGVGGSGLESWPQHWPRWESGRTFPHWASFSLSAAWAVQTKFIIKGPLTLTGWDQSAQSMWFSQTPFFYLKVYNKHARILASLEVSLHWFGYFSASLVNLPVNIFLLSLKKKGGGAQRIKGYWNWLRGYPSFFFPLKIISGMSKAMFIGRLIFYKRCVYKAWN